MPTVNLDRELAFQTRSKVLLNSKEKHDGEGGGRRGTLTKHQEINCIHDVELDTTLHSTILDRKTDASSGRDAMLRGMWTRIWGERVGGRDHSWSRDSGAAGLSLLVGLLPASGFAIGFGEQTSPCELGVDTS